MDALNNHNLELRESGFLFVTVEPNPVGPWRFDVHVIPETDDTFDLGEDDSGANVHRWRKIFTMDLRIGRVTADRPLKVNTYNDVISERIDLNDGTNEVMNQLNIANGGTGASTAAGARTNLDVYSKSEVDNLLAGKSDTTHTHTVNSNGSHNHGGAVSTDGSHTHTLS